MAAIVKLFIKTAYRLTILAWPILGVISLSAQGSGIPPTDTWKCPDSHPIKGNRTTDSGECIYHVPSSTYYSQTKPEVCFASEQGARAASCRAPRGRAGEANLSPVSLGIYHLPNQVDAVNLSLNADGTFFWNVCGCDYSGFSQGRWVIDENGLTLSSLSGSKLTWFTDFSLGSEVKTPLKVENGPGPGEITITGEVISSSNQATEPSRVTFVPIRQVWKSGRLCAKCEGPLGPTGQELCDAPLIMDKPC
jgi:hypothetical protein